MGPTFVTTRRPPTSKVTTQAEPTFAPTAGARSGDHTQFVVVAFGGGGDGPDPGGEVGGPLAREAVGSLPGEGLSLVPGGAVDVRRASRCAQGQHRGRVERAVDAV